MLIYISSATDATEDYELVGSIKQSLLKDEHEIITFYEVKEKNPDKDAEFYIAEIGNIMNNYPFDMIIFMPGWVEDKKSNMEIITAQFGHTLICEYIDGEVKPINKTHEK